MNARACISALLWPALLLAGCSGQPAASMLGETVQPGDLTLAIQATGDLKAIHSTPLTVPGQQWTPRQLAWVADDGSIVKKGQLVARFSADQSKQDLAEAMIDLQRNAIARIGKQADLGQQQGQLKVDLAQVAGQLNIAHRYADAGEIALSRNQVLDAVQDVGYLNTKQGILDWRKGQSSKRGSAELAVLGAQRATYQLNAKQKQDDLEALELHAPHDGILVLETDWSGAKPRIGGSMFAGMPLGSLPDTSALQVEISVPQVQAQGVRVGDVVQLYPRGQPDQTVDAKISWVAAAAQTRSRESPVKYLQMKAPVPAAAVTRYGWIPGQHFDARIILLHAEHALSVPNLAIDSSGSGSVVQVREGARVVKREIKLGVRGAARSQVLAGLKPGDQVVLDTDHKDDNS